jgi:hypothetical protein
MTQEATSAPTNPLEGTIPNSPASEQPVTEQPAPESGPEGEAPEGEAAGAETQPEPAPWASITEASAVLEHEAIRPLVEESNKTAYDKAFSDVQGRLQPIYTRNRETLDGINTAAADILTEFRRAREDNVLDKRTVEDLLRHHGRALDTLRGVQVTDTVGNVLGDLAQRMGFTASPATQMGYQDWKEGRAEDTAFLDDFVQDMKRGIGQDMVTKEEAEKLATKRLNDYKATQAKQQEVQQASGKGPNLAPGSPAGGLPMSYEAYMNRTPEEDEAISDDTHRQMYQEGIRRQSAK